ncbi:MAG TPA: hypothetical protein VER96_22655 [Polyangiaceae bacterium]|nr:hypothetical protein [Polyangiaceae bacterium]
MTATHALTMLTVLALACSRTHPGPESTGIAATVTAAPVGSPNEVASVAPSVSETAPQHTAAPPSEGAAAKAPRLEHASAQKRPNKARGSACVNSFECGAGLSCCQTGFRGHCGGAFMPDAPPCVFLSTCAPSPCVPLTLPP